MKEEPDEEKKNFFSFLKKKTKEDNKTETEAEIKSIVTEGHEKGFIKKNELAIINNIFEFAEKEANDIMIHRTNIVAIDAQSTIEEAFMTTMENGFSRYPVYLEDINGIIGILHIRDLVKVYSKEENRQKTLLDLKENVIIDAYAIPETRSISRLLQEMQQNKIHMAIVVDEYGQSAGIVTMEDILEEIFGNIWDEHDKPEIGIVRNQDTSYTVQGTASLEELADCLSIEFDTQDYVTLNGFMTYRLGHIPNEKESFVTSYGGYLFEILEVKDKVVTKVHITKINKIDKEVYD